MHYVLNYTIRWITYLFTYLEIFGNNYWNNSHISVFSATEIISVACAGRITSTWRGKGSEKFFYTRKPAGGTSVFPGLKSETKSAKPLFIWMVVVGTDGFFGRNERRLWNRNARVFLMFMTVYGRFSWLGNSKYTYIFTLLPVINVNIYKIPWLLG